MRYHWTLLSLVAVMATVGCRLPYNNNLPPAAQMMQPGPGVGGPGPGVMTLAPQAPPQMGLTSQVAFVGPEGMLVSWDVFTPGMFDSEPLVVPGRYNFGQGAIYRLKLENIQGRPGVELYPTIEVAPATPRTSAYLAHNAVPFQLTEEDLDQVLTGNFVTKVIYLPDAEFQELALAGVETLVSTRLDPGVDPIVEADRRGSILAIIRVGNKDLQVPGGDGSQLGGYEADMLGAACPPGVGPGGAGGAMPAGYISGVTGPEYGMPYSGTPIGLPGPPHIPLGHPASLQKHVIRNHTHVHMPKAPEKVLMSVKQSPKMSYPAPANKVRIHENARSFGLPNMPSIFNRFQRVRTTQDPNCPPGSF